MNIAKRVQTIQKLIDTTAKQCQRASDTITLMAVSKGRSTTAIEATYQAGIRDFGENYLQEAQRKIQTLAHLPLCWHFIGAIQMNKTASIAHSFHWIHSVCCADIARKLASCRPQHLPPLQICLQINLDAESHKSGMAPADAATLASLVKQLPQLQLRGLMAIPKPEIEKQQQYASLIRLTELLHDLNARYNLAMDTLSMGMSNDFLAAIRAGATIIRIGRAIFSEYEIHDEKN